MFYNPVWRESMFSTQIQVDYGRLRAPREDRTALIEPPLEEVGELVAENLHERDRLHGYDLHGRWLSDIALQARAELLAAARRWTAAVSKRVGRAARSQRPDLSGRPSAADVSSGRVVQELRAGRGGPTRRGDGNQLAYRRRHPLRRRGARARRIGRSATFRTGAVRLARCRHPLRGAKDRRPGTVRLVRPPRDRTDVAVCGRSAASAVLADGGGPLARVRQPRGVSGAGAASVGSIVGFADAGSAAELDLPRRGIPVVRRATCSSRCRSSARRTTNRCTSIGSGIACGAATIPRPT